MRHRRLQGCLAADAGRTRPHAFRAPFKLPPQLRDSTSKGRWKQRQPRVCGPTGVSGTPFLSLKLLWDGQGSAQTRQLKESWCGQYIHHPEQAELASYLQEHPSHSQAFLSVFINKTNAPKNKTGTSPYTVDKKSETFSFSVARVLLIPQELLTGARSCLLEAPVSV